MIIGIDEVGRGCWAGPLMAGAVALAEDFAVPDNADIRKLTDSKQLTKKQREATEEQLKAMGVAFGLGWVTATELDEIGISRAVVLAMRRAYDALPGTSKADAKVIIDGAVNYLPEVPGSEAIVKADGSVAAVSAASVLAKVARDNWMVEAAERYPGYGFEKHVGYGTKVHSDALRELGVCELHRRSFKPIAALLK